MLDSFRGFGVSVNEAIAVEMAGVLRRQYSSLEKLDLYDERFYPPRDYEPELAGMFFLVMVALDHRLSRPGKPYRACLEDGCYRGADLLYRLGVEILKSDPGFYSPANLEGISVEDVMEKFNVGEARVPDPEIRAYLLRDLGYKLNRLYNGSFLELLRSSNNRIRGLGSTPGLVDNLRAFRAYEDPVEKKPFLLIKFLIGRDLFRPVDPDNMSIPIDNHLARIAYRTGLVRVYGRLWEYIKGFREVSYSDDVVLRYTIRYAYEYVAEQAGIPKGGLDDILWVMGREICLRDEEPRCSECPFKSFCAAYRDTGYMVKEHNYYNTWYY